MEIKPVSKDEYIKIWNQNKLHALQSYSWGEGKIPEWNIIRLGFFESGHLINVVSVQAQSKNYLNYKINFGYIAKLKNLNTGLVNLVDYLKQELKLDFCIIEPEDINQAGLLNNLKSYAGHIQPMFTQRITLAKTEEELLSQMKSSHRQNIKKAIRENVEIEIYEKGNEAVEMFYQVLAEVFKNTKMLARGKAYYQKIWQSLNTENLAQIFIARLQEKVVGSYFVVYDAVGAYELYGGVTKLGRENEAGYLLKWKSIREANAMGKSFYDHWGMAKKLQNGNYNPKDELFRISQFKEGFGGEYLAFPENKVTCFNAQKYEVFLTLSNMNLLFTRAKKLFKFLPN